jgi:hypothetical protein
VMNPCKILRRLRVKRQKRDAISTPVASTRLYFDGARIWMLGSDRAKRATLQRSPDNYLGKVSGEVIVLPIGPN